MKGHDSIWVWIDDILRTIFCLPYLFLILFDEFKERLK